MNFKNQKNFLIKKTGAAKDSDPLWTYRKLQRQKSFQCRSKIYLGPYCNIY